MLTIKTCGDGVFKVSEGITVLSPKIEKMVKGGEILLYDTDIETFTPIYEFYKFYVTLSQEHIDVLKDLTKLTTSHEVIKRWYEVYTNIPIKNLLKVLQTAQDLEMLILPDVICFKIAQILKATLPTDVKNLLL